jgi:hypothetical protein
MLPCGWVVVGFGGYITAEGGRERVGRLSAWLVGVGVWAWRIVIMRWGMYVAVRDQVLVLEWPRRG